MTFELEHLTLSVAGQPMITDVSLTLNKGEMNVLLGPTLAGKTSLLRLMAGIDRPTSGKIRSNGVDITKHPVQRRSVAMVYQQFVNYPSMTVFENIASPLRVARVPSVELETRVKQAAKVLRLDNLLGRIPAELSGGQQQRTAIARALVKRAELVLLDEPLANLDYKLREELRDELPRIFAESGAYLVYATSEPLEAMLLRGTSITMHEGRVTQVGPTADVYWKPNNIQSARLFSDPPMNELQVRKRGKDLFLTNDLPLPISIEIPDGDAETYRLGFRADALSFGELKSANPSLPGKVVLTEINGSETVVHVDVGFATWVGLVSGVKDWSEGQSVKVQIDRSKIFVFDSTGKRLGNSMPTASE